MTDYCACVKYHTPEPTNFDRHHILPKSWGGANTADNIAVICQTTHENIHTLLNHYVRLGGLPPWEIRSRYNSFVRDLAQRAWDQRGSYTPYTSSMIT